jgi:hypothetical protein
LGAALQCLHLSWLFAFDAALLHFDALDAAAAALDALDAADAFNAIDCCLLFQDPTYMLRAEFAQARSRGADVPPVGAAAAAAGGGTGGGGNWDSPKRSGSGMSQLFDALVMAATGGTEGAAAGLAGGEAPVDSRVGVASAAAAANAVAPVAGLPGNGRPTAGLHALPGRQKSRLWSALSYGDVDSLQNALDAFRVRMGGLVAVNLNPNVEWLRTILFSAWALVHSAEKGVAGA